MTVEMEGGEGAELAPKTIFDRISASSTTPAAANATNAATSVGSVKNNREGLFGTAIEAGEMDEEVGTTTFSVSLGGGRGVGRGVGSGTGYGTINGNGNGSSSGRAVIAVRNNGSARSLLPNGRAFRTTAPGRGREREREREREGATGGSGRRRERGRAGRDGNAAGGGGAADMDLDADLDAYMGSKKR